MPPTSIPFVTSGRVLHNRIVAAYRHLRICITDCRRKMQKHHQYKLVQYFLFVHCAHYSSCFSTNCVAARHFFNKNNSFCSHLRDLMLLEGTVKLKRTLAFKGIQTHNLWILRHDNISYEKNFQLRKNFHPHSEEKINQLHSI